MQVVSSDDDTSSSEDLESSEEELSEEAVGLRLKSTSFKKPVGSSKKQSEAQPVAKASEKLAALESLRRPIKKLGYYYATWISMLCINFAGYYYC